MQTLIDTIVIFVLISAPFWIEAAVWLVGRVI